MSDEFVIPKSVKDRAAAPDDYVIPETVAKRAAEYAPPPKPPKQPGMVDRALGAAKRGLDSIDWSAGGEDAPREVGEARRGTMRGVRPYAAGALPTEQAGGRIPLPEGVQASQAGAGRGNVNPYNATVRRADQPFADKREALDEAVNLIEEGVDRQAIYNEFEKAGIFRSDIEQHGLTRRSPAFGTNVHNGPPSAAGANGAVDQPWRKAPEPTMLEGAMNMGTRAKETVGRNVDVMANEVGWIPDERLAELFSKRERKIQAARPGESVRAGQEAISEAGKEGFGAALMAMAENPRATFTMLADSALQSLPSSAAGAGIGSIAGPGGAAIGAGAGSAATEYANTLVEAISAAGLDPRNPAEVLRAMNNPAVMDAARRKGATRGVAVGVFDALSAGIAGRFLAPALRTVDAGGLTAGQARRVLGGAAAKEAAAQVGTGAAGEATAQKLTGDFNASDILLEGLAELPGGAIEVGANVTRDLRQGGAPNVSAFDLAKSKGFFVEPPLKTDSPVAQRSKVGSIFENIASLHAIPEQAVAKAKEIAASKPLAEVGPFFARFLGALQKRGLAPQDMDPDVLATMTAGPIDPPEEGKTDAASRSKTESSASNSEATSPVFEADTAPIDATELLGTPSEQDAPGAPRRIAGDPIDAEWTAFAPESGTKGVPRADMPQIKAEHRGPMVNFLAARGITHEMVEVPAAELKPTQAEFSPAKVAQAREYKGGDRSILVSRDGHILDGHHQWLDKLDAGQPVKAIALNATMDELLPVVREFPSAQVSDGATLAAAGESANGPAGKLPAVTPVGTEARSPAPNTPKPAAGSSSTAPNTATGEKAEPGKLETPPRQLPQASAADVRLLRKHGYQASAPHELARAFDDGDRVFFGHDMEEARPTEAFSIEDLKGYTLDQIIVLPAKHAGASVSPTKPPVSPSSDAAAAPAHRVIARAGRTPNAAQPIELRPNADGTLTPFMEGHAMLDFDSGEPIVLPSGVSDVDAKKAIRAAGAVSEKVNFFAPEKGKQASPPAEAAPAAANQARADLDAGLKELGGVLGKKEEPAPAPQAAAKTTPKARKVMPVRGSRALGLVSWRLKGLSPDLLADLSTKVVRTRVNRKTGKKTEYTTYDNPPHSGFGPLFRKGGTADMAEVARVLEEEGFITPGLMESDPLEASQQAEAIIKAELAKGGSTVRVGDADSIDREMQRRAEAAMGDELPDDVFGPLDDDDLAEAGYSEASEDVRRAVELLMAEAEAAGLDVEALREDAARLTDEGQSDDEYHAQLQRLAAEAIAQARRHAAEADASGAQASGGRGSEADGRQGPQDQQADEGLTLSAQTSADLEAKTGREGRAGELDERQQIDAERDLFGLQQQTADNREDNTGDLFGGPSVADVQRAAEQKRKATGPSGPDLFSEAPAQTAADRAADRDRRAGDMAAKYGLKPSLYQGKPVGYHWSRVLGDGDSEVSLQASFNKDGAEAFNVTRTPTQAEVDAGTLYETSKSHLSLADAERDIAEWVAQREGQESDKKLPGGLVTIPADPEAVGELLESLAGELNQADGESERMAAMFGPQPERVSLPRIMGGKVPAGVKFYTPQEAKLKLKGWKDEAKRQNKAIPGENGNRVVISLFDASGVLAKPWADAGYIVYTYDLQTGADIAEFDAQNLLEQHGNDNVFAILAQPPCTDFAASGARWWKDKDEDGRTKASTELVNQVLRTVELFRPSVWVMENPVGRVQDAAKLPDPTLQFDPWHFGDTYSKRTLLWGRFNPNLPTAMVEPTEGSKMHKMSSSAKYERSLTPEGWAYSFFMANNADAMGPAGRLAAEFAGVERELFDAAIKAGKSEYDIRSAIEDSYYENDLETVREALAKMAPTAPSSPTQRVVRPGQQLTDDERAAIAAKHADREQKEAEQRAALQSDLDAGKFVADGSGDDEANWTSAREPMKKGDQRRYIIETPKGNVQVNLDGDAGWAFGDIAAELHGLSISETAYKSLAGMRLSFDDASDPYALAKRLVEQQQAERDAKPDAKKRKAKKEKDAPAATAPTPAERKPRAKSTKVEAGDSDAVKKAKADLMAGLGDLASLLAKPGRSNIVPEDEQKLLPILTKVFDAAFRLGYHSFKDAAKFVLDQIRNALGDEAAGAVTLDHLQGAYIGMAGRYKDAGASSKKDVVAVEDLAEIEAHQADNAQAEEADVSDTNPDLERDSQDAADSDAAVGTPVSAGGAGAGQGDRQAGGRAGDAGRRPAGDPGVPFDSATLAGERGNQPARGGNRESQPALFDARADDDQRGGDSGESRVPPETIPASEVAAAAHDGLSDGAKRAAQRAAEAHPVKPGDLANVRATLPYLLPEQQEDVHKAEVRLAKEDGYGMLFTNGTGTGKTFTGLGVVKRYARQGKTNTLIVVPDAKIMADWVESGLALGLKITPLEHTKDTGRGITITTYANLGENLQLVNRQWDLIVPDEAHSLMQSADGGDTKALDTLRALSYHPRGKHDRYSMLNHVDIERQSDLSQRITSLDKMLGNPDTMDDMRPSLQAERAELEKQWLKLSDKLSAAKDAVYADVAAKQGQARTRVVALSATPFAYEKTVDWAEGYLFDYKDGYPYDETSTRYNQPSPREYFFITRFGYSMRVNKLTEPGPKVDRGLMQRQFNAWLRKTGALSGRQLEVAADYDRRFILAESAIGTQIDKALNWLSERARQNQNAVNGYRALREQIDANFDHLGRRYFLEAIKAKEVVPHVREHMKRGRKVVVFHDFKKGGSVNPFRISDVRVTDDPALEDSRLRARAINEALAAFRAEFPELVGDELLRDLSSPIERFKREFPGVLLINGDEKPRDLLARYKAFNDDANGPMVALVQSAKNKGWSGHDTTGKHQRVLFNLGLPTQPTMTIQQEGRIYRTGQVSDAIFRYLNTGTNWERWAFARTIAERASAAENLGSGEQARALKDSFITAFESSGDYPAGHEGEGKGGKALDRQVNAVASEYDRAKAYYWATQKKTSRTKAEEGKDYFATPEPVGLKMVQWADVRGGEDALEPSAGHGAIARWFPETVNRTAIEPSSALASRMALVFGDAKILDGTFEDHHVVNKYDVIVMNPPFGSGGRTAIDHLAKAAKHLRDGGRIVALIPTGPAADAKFEKWFYDSASRPAKPLGTVSLGGMDTEVFAGDTLKSNRFGGGGIVTDVREGKVFAKAEGQNYATGYMPSMIDGIARTGPRTESYRPAEGLHLVGDVRLPAVTFERAGTGVMTRIVVIDKAEPQYGFNVSRDLTSTTDINELFNELEEMVFPARTKPIEDVKPTPAEQKAQAKAEREHAKAEWLKAQAAAAEDGAKVAADTGMAIVEHVTGKGKTLRGVVRTDLTVQQAKEIDAFTFKKDGGYFIREKHLAELAKKHPKLSVTESVADDAAQPGNVDSSPRQNDTQKYRISTNRNHLNVVARFQEAFAEADPSFVLQAVEAPGDRPDLRSATAVARGIAGHDIIYVRQPNGRIFNGVASSGLSANYVLIDVDSPRPVMAVVGHELLHRLRATRPDLYDRLHARIERVLKDEGEYRRKLNARYEKLELDLLSDDALREEIIADVFGDEWADPAFWRELAADRAPGFKAIVAELLKHLDDLIQKITRLRPFGTDQYLSDLKEARAAVIEATREFSAGEVGALAEVPAGLRFSVAPSMRSEAFKAWFGDSKVVDADGKPLVVYHGTSADIESFKMDGAMRNKVRTLLAWATNKSTRLAKEKAATFFTDSPELASDYAATGSSGQVVMPAYLSIQRPVVMDFASGQLALPGGKTINVGGITNAALFSNEPLIDMARQHRADGVIMRSVRDHTPGGHAKDVSTVYIAFRPEQIKSATGNGGGFDPRNSDIRMSVASAPASPAELKPSSAPLDKLLQLAGGNLLARITSPAYDRLLGVLDRGATQLVGQPYLYAKAGLVADFGLTRDYKDARADMRTGIRKGTREAATIIEQLQGLTRAEARVAYLWMQEKPDTATERELMAALPEESRELLQGLKTRVDELGRQAVQFGLLSQETYERNSMAYLHRSYKKYETADASAKTARAKAVRILGDQFKGRGLRDDVGMQSIGSPDWWARKDTGRADTAIKGQKFHRLELRELPDQATADLIEGGASKRLGKLRQVVYWPAGETIPKQYADWRNDGQWEARFFDKSGKVGMWRDFTLAERTAMGEIQEVRYSAAKTLLQATRDVETARLLDWVARRESKVSEDQLPEGAEVVKATESLGRSYLPHEWVQVPTAAIPGTAGVRRYGNLAGRFVPGPVWNDLRQIASLSDQGDIAKLYGNLLTAWKVSKTALSPATHMNNVLSNFMLADAHDIQAGHVLRSLKVWNGYRKGDAEAKKVIAAYQDNGGDGGKFNEGELREDVMGELLAQLERDINEQDGATALVSAAQVVDLIKHREFRQAFALLGQTKTAGKVSMPFKKMVQLYGVEDEFFRLAAFIKARDDGLSDREAGHFAQDSFLNYNINAPWIQAARRSFFPFISFTYRAVPMLLRTFADKPHKLAKYALVAGALNAAAYAMLGDDGDEEKERALMPEEKSGKIWGIFPKLMRMPWNDEHGSPVFLDVRRWVPGGDIADTGSNHAAVPVPAPLMPGGPLVILGEVLANKTMFTGKELTKETDTLAEKYAKVGDYLWKSAAPNLPGVPGTYSTDALLAAGGGKTDVFGREQSVGQAVMSSVGIKLSSYPRDTLERNAALEARAKINEILAGMRADARQAQRKGITEEELLERQATAQQKIQAINADLEKRFGRVRGDLVEAE